ncbi:recombinase RecA [Latilactobacillus graminis]|uniref:Protein RecA n=1 Tax=Latilactobacillus graminis DSM 20719 TaxID=1423752 RepID=A0AA89I5G6_9LACO|nr:recombinase RecA [Latilactobacillus graminis]KRM23493.1 recombination protein A [Latilactobacillus graminis DSM 20719]
MGNKPTVKKENITQLTDKQDRSKALEAALTKITKNFGQGSIMRMGQNTATQIEVAPTGILSLDLALGVGGLPKGRIVEMYGPESSGKSTIAMQAVAEVQRAGGIAAYIDAENAMDPVYAKKLGVDIDNLYLSQPDTGEQGLEIADKLIESAAIDILVVDSVAALVPRAEIEGEMGDAHVGLQARMMSQALRKLSGTINKNKTVVIFINQIREKVGVMFGSPETTPGGRALKFYASVRLDVRRDGGTDKDDKDDKTKATGQPIKIKVVKNKVAPPFKTAHVHMVFGEGVDPVGDILDQAIEHEIAEKSGSWFNYDEIRLGQGRGNAVSYLRDHEDVLSEIDRKLRAIIFPDNHKENQKADHNDE